MFTCGPPRPRGWPFFFFPIFPPRKRRTSYRSRTHSATLGNHPKRSQNRHAAQRRPQESNSRAATKIVSQSSRPGPERSPLRPFMKPVDLARVEPLVPVCRKTSVVPWSTAGNSHRAAATVPPPHQSVTARRGPGIRDPWADSAYLPGRTQTMAILTASWPVSSSPSRFLTQRRNSFSAALRLPFGNEPVPTPPEQPVRWASFPRYGLRKKRVHTAAGGRPDACQNGPHQTRVPSCDTLFSFPIPYCTIFFKPEKRVGGLSHGKIGKTALTAQFSQRFSRPSFR
jgi:hypothetical protein